MENWILILTSLQRHLPNLCSVIGVDLIKSRMSCTSLILAIYETSSPTGWLCTSGADTTHRRMFPLLIKRETLISFVESYFWILLFLPDSSSEVVALPKQLSGAFASLQTHACLLLPLRSWLRWNMYLSSWVTRFPSSGRQFLVWILSFVFRK